MKECPRCKRLLPLSDFGVRTNGKPQHWCRACHCSYQREYYERHKLYYAELQNQRIARNRDGIRKAKEVPCADCGRSFPYYVMDFDHRPGEVKCFNLANAAGSPRLSWEKIEAEIKKCDVVCANCHRIRTHERKKQKRKNKSAAVAQSVEYVIGNDEVLGSNPSSSSGNHPPSPGGE